MFSQNSSFNMLQHLVCSTFSSSFRSFSLSMPKARLQQEAQIYEPLRVVSHREIGLLRCNVHCSLFSDVRVWVIYTSLPKLPIIHRAQGCKAATSHNGSALSVQLSLSISGLPTPYFLFSFFYLGSDLCIRVPAPLETVRLALCGLWLQFLYLNLRFYFPSVQAIFLRFVLHDRMTGRSFTVSSHVL